MPWMGGALWLMYAESLLIRGSTPNRIRQAGYGFFLGYAVLFLAITTAHTMTGTVSWPWLMVFLLLFTGSGGLALWRGVRASSSVAGARFRAERKPAGTAAKILLTVLLTWMVFHLVFVAVENLTQVVYPWDAWLAWAYRAKAWYMAGGMADIISPTQWMSAGTAGAFTVEAWTYPLFPSVIPYWAALSLGRWSETLVNLPALFACVAIGLALYGQCREYGMGALASLLCCYLLFSVPLFATHVALAGYADIWMAGFVGLGFVAILRGAVIPGGGQTDAERKFQTVLGLLLIALSIGIKNEGAVWFVAALALMVLVRFRLRVPLLIVAAVSGAMWLGFDHVELPFIGLLGIAGGRLHLPFIGSFELEMHDIWRVYLDNFFAKGSWNLLWVGIAASLLLAITPRGDRVRRAGFSFIFIFLATQLFIFGFTDQGLWADTYTAINRLPLHFIPALIFAAATMTYSRLKPKDAVTNASVARITTTALTASLASAAIVFAGAAAYLSRDLPRTGGETHHFPAAGFKSIMGSSRLDGEQLIVDGFSGGYALLSSGPVSIQAGTHRLLEFSWEPLCNQKAPAFFWREKSDAENLSRITLGEVGEQSIDLAGEAEWRGEISEIGFLFTDNNGEPATLGAVRLQLDGLGARLNRMWKSWVHFERWSQRSVNYLHGGSANQQVSLPMLLIIWLAVTMLLLWLTSKLTGKPGSHQLLMNGGVLFLAAWMLLDARWTANNLRQLHRSIESRWHTNDHERLLQGSDCGYYPYIQQLKDESLGDEPARILIVATPDVIDFYPLRAKYHLPPHSAHVVRELPASRIRDSLDYVIFFGAAGDITHLPGWNTEWQQALIGMDGGGRGLLYRVETQGN